jgi:hypothetical protein
MSTSTVPIPYLAETIDTGIYRGVDWIRSRNVSGSVAWSGRSIIPDSYVWHAGYVHGTPVGNPAAQTPGSLGSATKIRGPVRFRVPAAPTIRKFNKRTDGPPSNADPDGVAA